MPNKLSKSPDRGTFLINSMIKNNPEDSVDLVKMQTEIQNNIEEQRNNTAWAENNMEYDLLSTAWILDKARESRVYAQHLYAALCNNEFQKIDVWHILKDQTWGCSWRHAGGIIADMRENGDYIDWYCSGIRNEEAGIWGHTQDDWDMLTTEQQTARVESRGFVEEGLVTEEIELDLKKLGWTVIIE